MTYYAPYFLQIIRYARLPTNFLGQSTLALVPKGVTVFSIKPSMSFSLSTKSLLFISMVLILDIYRYLKYINFSLLENISQKLRSAHRGETQKFSKCRWGVETSYRVTDEVRIKTTTLDEVKRSE